MSKKWYVIIICVLSFGAFGFAAEKTPDTDCFQLVLGEIVQLKTNVVSDSTNKIRAFAYIRMARDVKYAREGMACTVHYDLYVSKNGAEFHSVKSLARKFGDTVGATIIGFSEDESKLAADFWWAAGDYTAHKR